MEVVKEQIAYQDARGSGCKGWLNRLSPHLVTNCKLGKLFCHRKLYVVCWKVLECLGSNGKFHLTDILEFHLTDILKFFYHYTRFTKKLQQKCSVKYKSPTSTSECFKTKPAYS